MECSQQSGAKKKVDRARLDRLLRALDELKGNGISAASLAPLQGEAARMEAEILLREAEAAREAEWEAEAIRAAERKARERLQREEEAAREAERKAKEQRQQLRDATTQQLAMCLRRATTTRYSGDLLALEGMIEQAAAAGVDEDKVRVARKVLARKGQKGGAQSDWDSRSAGDERWYEAGVKFR